MQMTSLTYKNNQSVLVVIYAESTHRVLMLQRQDDSTFWQSVTGTLESNEIGLKIEENSTALFDCKESIEFEIFPHFRYKYAPNVTHCHEHWFLLAVEQEFEPILSEHLSYQWVSPEDAIQMTKSPNNAEAIKKYLMNGFPL